MNKKIILSYAALLLVIVFLIAFLFSCELQSKKVLEIDLHDINSISDNIIHIFSNTNYIAYDGKMPLGIKISKLNSSYEKGDISIPYNFRESGWKKTVSFDQWSQMYKKIPYNILSIKSVGANPLPTKNLPSKAIQFINYALVKNKNDNKTDVIFYNTIWIFNSNGWEYLGGAPWEEPCPPVLEINKSSLQ